jgi:hypothetical protein
MELSSYEQFTREVHDRLAADPRVLGLLALGSTADASCRDQWSDHDFWVITEAGGQEPYLNETAWLPRPEAILLRVRHGKSYRMVLYSDSHQVEFAVFDPSEALQGKIERFAILLDRGGVRALAESVCERTGRERQTALAWPDQFANSCALLVTACGRFQRGEVLSARRYIDCFAIDCLLNLVLAHESPAPEASDRLDPRRRLEQSRPTLAEELLRGVAQPVPQAALALLQLAERELAARTPQLPWSEARQVRAWLQASVAATAGNPGAAPERRG